MFFCNITLGANRTVAERDMLDVVHLEIELAKISSSEDSRREPNRLYNRFTKLELKNKFPKVYCCTMHRRTLFRGLNQFFLNIFLSDRFSNIN